MFRTMYDKSNWLAIISTLKNASTFKQIQTLSRRQLVSDSLIFSKLDILDYDITLKLMMYLQYERQFSPWHAAINGLDPIGKLLSRTPNYQNFQVGKTEYKLLFGWSFNLL